MKKILLLGSTGSIGKQTLEVIKNNSHYFKVVGLSCNKNIELLKEQIKEFKPQYVAIGENINGQRNNKLKKNIKIVYGEKGILKLVETVDYDIIVVAIVGAAGLLPAITAINRGKNIALATKEVMVLAGMLVKKLLKDKNIELKKKGKPAVRIFPIDSEHSAIWQSLRAGQEDEVEKIILTCSGGPFRNRKLADLHNITAKDALNHPTWNMGRRITIDSATLMNKGLEVIEAQWLFNIPASKIEVVIHPQSILHSAVVYRDGSIIGQFGLPDMRLPIQYALSYPDRLQNNLKRLSLPKLGQMTFESPDIAKFPCLSLAYEALKKGGSMPVVLNAADEIVVEAFLNNKIRFLDIPKIIKEAMRKHKVIKNPSLKEIIKVDKWARQKTRMIINNYPTK